MRLTVFTTNMCHACHEAMDYLRGRNYQFAEVDIRSAESMLRVRTGGKRPTAPTLYDSDSGRLVVGFQPDMYDRFLDGR